MTQRKVAGIIAIWDEVRPEAKEVLSQFKKTGIKISILTGDNEVTAQAIPRILEVGDVNAGLKAADKVAAIEELKKKPLPIT